MEHFFDRIRGYFNYQDLYEQVVKEAAEGSLFVEVGAWKGKSAAFMGVEIVNSGKKIRLDLVDNFQGLYQEFNDRHSMDYYLKSYRECAMNLRNLPFIKLVGLPSDRAVELYGAGSIDFLYIDANHTYESVSQDILLWLPKVKPGGIIAGHDYGNKDYPGVKRAVDELLPEAEQVSISSWMFKKS